MSDTHSFLPFASLPFDQHFLVPELGAPAVRLMKTIKGAVDPDNLMNPGKVLPAHASLQLHDSECRSHVVTAAALGARRPGDAAGGCV